ncbi:pollen development protein LAP3 [Tanacetum coccineum]
MFSRVDTQVSSITIPESYSKSEWGSTDTMHAVIMNSNSASGDIFINAHKLQTKTVNNHVLRCASYCSPPLGLKMDKSNGNLYLADAYFGLIVVDTNGGLATSLASRVEGIPLLLTNALEIDYTNGVIYFTDSSQRYTCRHAHAL